MSDPEESGSAGGFAAVGQSFTVPSNGDNFLKSISFHFWHSKPAAANYSAALYLFDSSTGKTTGSALYLTGSGLAPDNYQTETVFNTDAQLIPNATYLFEMTWIGGPNADLNWLMRYPDIQPDYPGGQSWYLYQFIWRPFNNPPSEDLIFTAVFTPEPNLLMAPLLIGVLNLRRISRS